MSVATTDSLATLNLSVAPEVYFYNTNGDINGALSGLLEEVVFQANKLTFGIGDHCYQFTGK